MSGDSRPITPEQERLAEQILSGSGIVGPSLVKRRALADPTYSPYCLRCVELRRMHKVDHLYWRCIDCGAEHDERDGASS